jgi:hypothetical protein
MVMSVIKNLRTGNQVLEEENDQAMITSFLSTTLGGRLTALQIAEDGVTKLQKMRLRLSQ